MESGRRFHLCIFRHSCEYRKPYPSYDVTESPKGRFSLLLALEGAPIGRATADRHGAARVDPADERRKPALGRATHSSPLPRPGAYRILQASTVAFPARYLMGHEGVNCFFRHITAAVLRKHCDGWQFG